MLAPLIGREAGYTDSAVLDEQLGRARRRHRRTVEVDDPEEARGAPNGALSDGFVSLGGGSLTGQFATTTREIVSGYDITVYEIGDAFCTGIPSCLGDEGYSVCIITDPVCTKDSASCATLCLSDSAAGEAEVVVPPF